MGGDKGAVAPPTLVDEMLTQAGPFAGQIGVGALAGYSAGLALRTVGKAAAVAVGALFCGVQVASYSGFVDVDWAKVERAVVGALDTDGDGKLGTNDAAAAAAKLQTLLAFNLPGGTGFATGLAFAAGGRAGKLVALSTAALGGPTLATAHAYTTSDSFRRTLEEMAPGVASMLRVAAAHTAAAQAAVAKAAAQPRALPTLDELRREEARARLEARLLAGDKKMTPQKQAAIQRCEARLVRIEEDKRAVKAAAKQRR